MDDTDESSGNNTHPDAPARLVTVNQIVAWNIAWLRREAGITQEQLGDLLGWPQHKVSEAERSWNGKRTREFDAQTLAGLAFALGVPVAAFFLPPVDESVYVIRPPGQEQDIGMAALMAISITDTDDDTEVMASYRRRLLNAVGKYLGDGWRKEVAGWLRRVVGLEAVREGAHRLRGLAAALLDNAAHATAWADALDEIAMEEESG